MAFKELLLAAILTWPAPWYPPGRPNPETSDGYKLRVATIAEAVVIESRDVNDWGLGRRALVAATLTLWYSETRFSYEVHALGTSRWGQDVGKARCLGQLHTSKLVPKSEWEQTVGADLEATRRCARATMRVIAAMARMCSATEATPHHMARVFAAYGSGRGCELSAQAQRRAQRWQRLMARI